MAFLLGSCVMQPSRGQGASQSHRGDAASATGSGLPETIGRYRLLSKIAKGGMAEVFAARSYGAHGFEKTVALKRILPRFGHDPQFVRMMVDEAKISVLLNHPNIAQIFELGEQDGDYFIVMEFVPGQSLSAVVKRLRDENQRLEVLDACFLVVELLQGLQAAHTQLDSSGAAAHIIHRDVSPQNTLLSFDGHVKVIDFGIARARDRLEATEVGTIKGKLRYLAPEMIDPGRFTKEGDFDHRVDVFAAGIVLWELIAARPLFPGDEELKVYDEITDGKTPDLAKEGRCDQALMRIINTALERSLHKRYASAEVFADELRAYVYRSDPSFTHKRIAGLLDKLFPSEKAHLLSLERGAIHPPPKPSRTSSSLAPVIVDMSKPERQHDDGGLAATAENAATARVDINDIDPDNELQRDVAVVTLVSRQKLLVDRQQTGSDGASGVFSRAEDATLTVGSDEARDIRGVVGAAVQPPMVTKTGPTLELPRRAQPVPATRDTLLDDMPPTMVGHEPNRRRVVVASAFVGVALALGIVTGVDHFNSKAKPPPVILAVTEPATDPGPTTSTTTALPTTPEPMPAGDAAVPVQAVVMPSHALVTVDGVPVTTTTTVKAGAVVQVVVSAPGFDTRETMVTAPETGPLVLSATLAETLPDEPDSGLPQTTTPPTKTPAAATSAPSAATARPRPKPLEAAPATATKGSGTLIIKTTPYWGKVVIDGKPEDDTTPLTLTLSAGRHDVVVSHPPKGLSKRFKVVVVANETVTRVITFD